MRKAEERKTETRQRIVEAAGALFRQYGIDAVGVDAIMHAAGLTHGGFYGHFPSKEALVAEVSAATLARSAERWARIAGGDDPDAALERIVGSYLDSAHVAAAERGCMLATLGPEVARRPEARPGVAASVCVMLQALQRCMPEAPPEQAKAALATMVGAVVLARLADDTALQQAFLDAAQGSVLRRTAT